MTSNSETHGGCLYLLSVTFWLMIGCDVQLSQGQRLHFFSLVCSSSHESDFMSFIKWLMLLHCFFPLGKFSVLCFHIYMNTMQAYLQYNNITWMPFIKKKNITTNKSKSILKVNSFKLVFPLTLKILQLFFFLSLSHKHQVTNQRPECDVQ